MYLSEKIELKTMKRLNLENEDASDSNEGYQNLVCNCLKFYFLHNTVLFNNIR